MYCCRRGLTLTSRPRADDYDDCDDDDDEDEEEDNEYDDAADQP